MIPGQVTETILDFYKGVKTIYKQNPERIAELQTEISDIQHVFGLNSHDAVALVKLAKELRQVLQDRWRIKDEIELAEPIYELFDKHFKFFEDLRKVDNDINKRIEVLENRAYSPRIRTDLVPGLLKQENNIVKLKQVMEMRNAK